MSDGARTAGRAPVPWRRRWRVDVAGQTLAAMTVLLYVYLYLPILVMFVLSFNGAELAAFPLRGVTLRWYGEVFRNAHLMEGLGNSLTVGVSTVVVSVPLGLMLAYVSVRIARRSAGPLSVAVLLPILTPRIILGVLLLIFFTFLGITLSLGTVLLGHIVLTMPFATLIIAARLRGIEFALEEAARDLGASTVQMWVHILVPLLWPAVLAAALISFTISFDEMVVSFFTTGVDSTLPVVIWAMVRYGYTQEMNAIGALIVASTLIIVTFAQRLRGTA
jgi:spermidine/putrescine transport system permease protein